MANNTFLGLQPYTEDDAYRFKGRTEESQELFRLIVRNDYTVCYAESGEGKTSLLNAGVFPLLREKMYFPIEITFTDDDYKTTPKTFDNIIDRCIKDSIDKYNAKNQNRSVEYKLCSTDFQGLSMQQQLQAELANDSWWKLRNYKPQVLGLTFTPVFVFDQFEEVFSQPGSVVWTKTFFDWLEDVSTDSCPERIIKKIRSTIGTDAAFPIIKEEKDFKAIFSLRKEYIGELDYWSMQQSFIPAMKDNRYCLKALTYDGAKKVMTQQKLFDADKVEQVLHYFVSQYSREPNRTISKNLPIIPALLLSVVGDSLEKDASALVSFRMSEIGQSLNTTLERFYDKAIDSVISKLSEQGFDVQSNQCRKDLDKAIFALIDGNGKRVRTKTTATALTQVDFDAIFKKVLCDQRLIKVSKIDNEDYVELVHDSLCPIVAKKKEQRLAEDAKEREQEILLEQKRKMRKRKIQFTLISFIAMIIVAFFLYQNIKLQAANKKIQVNYAKSILHIANHIIEDDSYTAQVLLLAFEPKQFEYDRSYTVTWESILRKAIKVNSAILNGHQGGVNSVCYSPVGNLIASSDILGNIIIWDALSGSILKQIDGERSIHSLAFSPSGELLAAGSNHDIKIFDSATWTAKDTIQTKEGYFWALSFSRDGKYLLSEVGDGHIAFWDCNDNFNKKFTTKDKHNSIITSISFSQDGDKILTCSWDKKINIWSYKTKELLKSLCGHTENVNSATFNKNGSLIVSGANDKYIRIWDVNKGVCIDSILGFRDVVRSVCFNENENKVISAGDHDIKIWDIETHICEKQLSKHSKLITRMAISPDRKQIATSSNDKTIRLWDIEEEKDSVFRKWELNDYSSINNITFFTNSSKFISSGNPTFIYDISSDDTLNLDYVTQLVSVSKDNQNVILVDGNSFVIYNIHTRKYSLPIKAHNSQIRSATFSPDGKKILTTSEDGYIKEWSVENGDSIRSFRGHKSAVTSASYSPNGSFIVSASKEIRIWDIKTGDCIDSIQKNDMFYRSIVFNQKGNSFLTATGDNKIILLDMNSLKMKRIYQDHTDAVNSIAFNNDESCIISSSDDGTCVIWDVETGIIIDKFQRYGIKYASISDDNKWIAISTGYRTELREFSPIEIIMNKIQKRFKNRQLTKEERQKYYLE